MNKTAVEWLMESLILNESNPAYNNWVFDKAKQLEKNQIMDAWNDGMCIQDTNDICAEYYYNETYNNE